MSRAETDWGRIIIHAICGAIFGAVVGLGWWAYLFEEESLKTGITCIVVVSLICAFLAGAWLDQFWELIKGIWYWLIP